MDDIKLFCKKLYGGADTNFKNTQPGYRREFGIEKSAMLIMKNRKRDK